MTTVEPGQEWIASSPVGRMRVRVIATDPKMTQCLVPSTGRKFSISTSTLSRGRRAARLVKNADGTDAAPPANRERIRHVDHRMVKALELREQDVPRTTIAERFNVSLNTIDRWLLAARRERPETPKKEERRFVGLKCSCGYQWSTVASLEEQEAAVGKRDGLRDEHRLKCSGFVSFITRRVRQ